jgi:hypothetical protein
MLVPAADPETADLLDLEALIAASLVTPDADTSSFSEETPLSEEDEHAPDTGVLLRLVEADPELEDASALPSAAAVVPEAVASPEHPSRWIENRLAVIGTRDEPASTASEGPPAAVWVPEPDVHPRLPFPVASTTVVPLPRLTSESSVSESAPDTTDVSEVLELGAGPLLLMPTAPVTAESALDTLESETIAAIDPDTDLFLSVPPSAFEPAPVPWHASTRHRAMAAACIAAACVGLGWATRSIWLTPEMPAATVSSARTSAAAEPPRPQPTVAPLSPDPREATAYEPAPRVTDLAMPAVPIRDEPAPRAVDAAALEIAARNAPDSRASAPGRSAGVEAAVTTRSVLPPLDAAAADPERPAPESLVGLAPAVGAVPPLPPANSPAFSIVGDAPPPPAARATPPREPPAAAPSPAADAAREIEAQVRQALSSYRNAYASLDAVAARRIWPNVDERALARAFGSLKSQQLEFDRCDITVQGQRATASCTGRAVYVQRVGRQDPQVESRNWLFTLSEGAGGWRIDQTEIR